MEMESILMFKFPIRKIYFYSVQYASLYQFRDNHLGCTKKCKSAGVTTIVSRTPVRQKKTQIRLFNFGLKKLMKLILYSISVLMVYWNVFLTLQLYKLVNAGERRIAGNECCDYNSITSDGKKHFLQHTIVHAKVQKILVTFMNSFDVKWK